MLEEGWLKRQMESASATTEKWPDWMKQEAGIYQPAPMRATDKQEQAVKNHPKTGMGDKETTPV